MKWVECRNVRMSFGVRKGVASKREGTNTSVPPGRRVPSLKKWPTLKPVLANLIETHQAEHASSVSSENEGLKEKRTHS